MKWRIVEFKEGNMVMIRVRPEPFSKGVYKELHSRSAGPSKNIRKISLNAYILDLPEDDKKWVLVMLSM